MCYNAPPDFNNFLFNTIKREFINNTKQYVQDAMIYFFYFEYGKHLQFLNSSNNEATLNTWTFSLRLTVPEIGMSNNIT